MNMLIGERESCVLSSKSRKMEHMLEVLTTHFSPFNQLLEDRLSEVVNLVRFMEMRAGEIFQIQASVNNDYLFVLEGRLDMIREGSIQTLVGPEKGKTKPVILAREFASSTLIARENSMICHAERQLVDHLISWDAVVIDEEDLEVRQRMEQVRNSLVFRRLPWESVEAAFHRMKSVSVKAQQTVIRQGEIGDAFYIITSGRAEVFHAERTGGEEKKIAEIGEGDAFGCEALISGKTRSETVRMQEDGTLLTLGKEDFDWLISKQMIRSVNAKVANTMMETGYKLIDVRSPEEFEFGHLPNAQLIPLFELKNRIAELDIAQRYILYCHSGSRSAVAALRLTQAGFDVQTLEGGFRDWKYEIIE